MRRITCTIAVTLAAVACMESSGPGTATGDDSPAGMVVSNALVSTGSGSSGVMHASIGAVPATVAYVSAEPGTFPAGRSVEIRNQTRGSGPTQAPVIDGGFDPVSVEANSGDELALAVSMGNGKSEVVTIKVPARRPPRVVRTNPTKGRTDVALNVVIEIVFSEPVNKASLTSSSLALKRDGSPVKGAIRVSDDGLTAEFIPELPLDAQTSYTLTVNDAIRDLEGDALDEPLSVDFKTGTVPPLGKLVVTATTTAAANGDMDPDGYSVSLDGGTLQPIGTAGTVTITDVPAGFHFVLLTGASDNCAVEADGRVNVEVVAGTTRNVDFRIACSPLPQLDGKIAFVSERDGNSEIYVANANGGGILRLTTDPQPDLSPAWSPDGKRIAFARGDGDMDASIYVMNADGSNAVRLVTMKRSSSPAWSPDGRKVAFSALEDGQFGIFVVDADAESPTPKRIGFERGYIVDPVWSPDGSRIAFVSDWRAYDFVYDLYVMNADGSNIRELIMGPFFWPDNTYYFQPAWSPDGRKIATVVCRYAFDNCYPNSSIAVANADGSELRTVAATGGFAHPTWSPDGTVIVYSSVRCRTCTPSIRYVAIDGGADDLLISNAHSPAWRR